MLHIQPGLCVAVKGGVAELERPYHRARAQVCEHRSTRGYGLQGGEPQPLKELVQ